MTTAGMLAATGDRTTRIADPETRVGEEQVLGPMTHLDLQLCWYVHQSLSERRLRGARGAARTRRGSSVRSSQASVWKLLSVARA